MLVDGTQNFQSNGLVSWTIPGDWATVAINSETKYWIRFSTTTEPVGAGQAYQILPGDSVVGLLALSSVEIQEEEWKWCSFQTAIYVTIRSVGNTNYEGNFYITSSSSSTNLQNFFIHNHTFSSDYQNSSYV